LEVQKSLFKLVTPNSFKNTAIEMWINKKLTSLVSDIHNMINQFEEAVKKK